MTFLYIHSQEMLPTILYKADFIQMEYLIKSKL